MPRKKPPSLVHAHRERAALRQQVAQADFHLADERPHLVVQRRPVRLEVEAHAQVVLQVAADGRQRMHERHALAREQRRIAHARQLQQLRRIDRAGREDHLARGDERFVAVFARDDHAGRTHAVERHAPHEHARAQREVRAAQRGAQVRKAAGAAFAVFRVQVVDARAFELRAVEIIGARQVQLAAALQNSWTIGCTSAFIDVMWIGPVEP